MLLDFNKQILWLHYLQLYSSITILNTKGQTSVTIKFNCTNKSLCCFVSARTAEVAQGLATPIPFPQGKIDDEGSK